MVALTWISCHGLPSRIHFFSQTFGVHIFSHRNDDNMAVRLKPSSLKRCTKTFQNSIVERRGHGKVLIGLFFGQVLPSALSPQPSIAALFKWENAALREKCDGVGSRLLAAPFFCLFSGECLPTAKTQLGWAVNSDSQLSFYTLSLSIKEVVYLFGEYNNNSWGHVN